MKIAALESYGTIRFLHANITPSAEIRAAISVLKVIQRPLSLDYTRAGEDDNHSQS